jgi:precorrin-6B methylase 2
MSEKRKPQLSPIPPVWFMAIINGVQRFFFKVAKRMVPPNLWMMNHVENFWLAKGVVTALELNLAEHIKDGNNSIGKLAQITGTDPDALFRLMRMLCAHEVFKLSKQGTYRLTPYSRVLIEGNNSVKYFIMGHLGKLHYELFAEMNYTVKTGINASQKIFNSDIFSHVRDSPEEHELFIRGMSNTSELFAPVLLSSYNFNQYKKIVDIGGGHGTLLCHILDKHKDLKAILFDSEHVVDRATENFESYGLRDRIEIIEGNFFEGVPGGADLYIMKNILHDWNDNDSTRILNNINKVMQSGSRLLIIETIINNDNKYSFGKMIDILMLVITKDGRERTLEEFKGLFEKSGFSINRIIPTITPFSLIECSKKL